MFHYETVKPENGLFNYKNDRNIVQDLLIERKKRNAISMPKLSVYLQKEVIEEEKVHETYI